MKRSFLAVAAALALAASAFATAAPATTQYQLSVAPKEVATSPGYFSFTTVYDDLAAPANFARDSPSIAAMTRTQCWESTTHYQVAPKEVATIPERSGFASPA